MPEITEQEFEIFKEYQDLGTPTEISDAIGELSSVKRTNAINDAARLNGYKTKVLDKLAKDVEIYVDGEKAYAKKDGEEMPLADFAEQEWGDFLSSLKEDQQDKSQVAYIPQSARERESGTKNVGKKMANNYITQKYGAVLKTESVN